MDDAHAAFEALEKLDGALSPALAAAVVRLVQSKHAYDALARRGDPLAAIAGSRLGIWQNEHSVPGAVNFFHRVALVPAVHII
jgi:hypothetical protein